RGTADVGDQYDIGHGQQGFRHMGFVGEYIQAGSRDDTLLQCCNQSVLVHAAATANIDEQAIRSQRLEHICIQNLPCFSASRQHRQQNITVASQGSQGFVVVVGEWLGV